MSLTIVRTMNTEAINHDPAMTYINTGTQQLGTSQHGFVAQLWSGQSKRRPARVRDDDFSVGAKPGQALFSRLWGSGFLPSRKHQGVQFRSGDDPVLYLSNPPGVDRPLRRKMLDGLIARLNAQEV